jgi:hypothetical protein
MYYKIDYPKFLELQQSLTPILLDAKTHVNVHKDRHSSEIQEFIKFLGKTPVLCETLRHPATKQTHCHRDLYAGINYIWSVNIPVIGYEKSYTHFWKTKGKPNKPNNLWVWELDRAELLSKHATTKIFVIDTRVPHSIHAENERYTYMLRMPLDWSPLNIKGFIDYES